MWLSSLPRCGETHLKVPKLLGMLHMGLHLSVGMRPLERPPKAPKGMWHGKPLLLFLYFSSRLNKPKEQDKFIKAHCLTKSWNVQGVSKHIVPLFSFSPKAPGESRKINQPTQLCSFFKKHKTKNNLSPKTGRRGERLQQRALILWYSSTIKEVKECG